MKKNDLEKLRDEVVAAAIRLNELAAAYNMELVNLHPLRRLQDTQSRGGSWFAARAEWPGVDDVYKTTKREIDYVYALASGLGKLTPEERAALYPTEELAPVVAINSP